jgi:diguanylate cyclase
VAAGAESQDWKKKYFDSLDSLDGEQRKFQAVEAALKRLLGRVCVAARGQSPKLDEQLKQLQAATRRDVGADELDKLATALTDAINLLDQPGSASPQGAIAQASSAATLAGEERIRAVMATLLTDLRRDPQLLIQVDALDTRLGAPMTREQLPDALASLTDLVGRRIQRIERTKQEMELLLSDMVGRLDEIGKFVAVQTQNQNQSLASSESLNSQLAGEMQAMGASVEAAVDLQSIRAQVRSRVDAIGKHLQEFRKREADRSSEMRQRNERMQARVSELESQANKLHNQLKDEQRAAIMDALTKVPNRLAYEKRMEEELKRFARFKQPTCVAVWDVDHFKRVNDGYGHGTGDKVLHAVAESLAARIRSTDFLARYGGEEFAMLLCGTKLDDAMRVLDTMRLGVANLKMHSRGTPLAITISCGVTALLPTDSAVTVFERADQALYKAKQKGRNCCMSG